MANSLARAARAQSNQSFPVTGVDVAEHCVERGGRRVLLDVRLRLQAGAVTGLSEYVADYVSRTGIHRMARRWPCAIVGLCSTLRTKPPPARPLTRHRRNGMACGRSARGPWPLRAHSRS